MHMYDSGVKKLIIVGVIFFAIMVLRVLFPSSGSEKLDTPNPLPSTPAVNERTPLAVPPPVPTPVEVEQPVVSTPTPVREPEPEPEPQAPVFSKERIAAWGAVTSEHGFSLATGMRFERTATYSVRQSSEEEGTFEGVGVLRARMPFETETFRGQVDDTGRTTIEFSTRSNPVVFDRVTGTDGLAQSRGTLGLQPLRQSNAERYADYDRMAKQAADQTTMAMTVDAYSPNERASVMQGLNYRSIAALARAEASTIYDINSATDRNVQTYADVSSGWVAYRYRQPEKTSGIVLNLQGGQPNVTLTVNGVEQTPLSFISRGGRPLTVVRFSEPIEVLDLHFEVFGGTLSIAELYLLNVEEEG